MQPLKKGVSLIFQVFNRSSRHGRLVPTPVQDDEGDSMSYDARKLITFEVFRATTGTIWVKAGNREFRGEDSKMKSEKIKDHIKDIGMISLYPNINIPTSYPTYVTIALPTSHPWRPRCGGPWAYCCCWHWPRPLAPLS